MSKSPAGLFSIAAGRPFLRELARGIVARFHKTDDPLALSSVTIFLPTRRGARTLSEELVRAAKTQALVLPAIRVLGDVDEDEGRIDAAADLGIAEAAVGRLERDLILAQMLAEKRRAAKSAGGFQVSLALARQMARLIDEVWNEDGDLSGLAGIVPAELAGHWHDTVKLLEVATHEWPALLEERGLIDPAKRRSELIRAFARRLDKQRPEAPFIVAGSSGSVKATADLIKVIAGLPNGAVVLDGLDRALDGESWDALIPSHPQFALRELLIHLGVARGEIGEWHAGDDDEADPSADRRGFLSEAMRPPETADRWASLPPLERPPTARGVGGLSLIEAANEREEALAVAIAIRGALEVPGRSVALVTPDRMLARRTAAELRRWDIVADDSAGIPLAKTEAGALAALVIEAAQSNGSPVALLSVLKHPRVALGGERYALLRLGRQIEKRLLRRGRVTGGFAEIRAAIAAKAARPEADEDERTRAAEWVTLVDRAEEALRPLSDAASGEQTLGAIVAGHVAALEALTRDAEGRIRAWRGEDGEALFALLQSFNEIHGLRMRCEDYAVAFDGEARGVPVRSQRPRHPRVAILGQQEARMQSADLMILGGLNEGVWPTNPADDPWLSRPMREKVKLSAPERRIGLAAHDFATLAAQREVLLTRAKRREGAPSNPSRFLTRIVALATGLDAKVADHPALEMARRIDRAAEVRPAERPMPCPPVAVRPRSLSVTRIETWVRDPYAIYAEQVLRLRPLEKLAQQRDARDRGTMIHKAFELFAARDAQDVDTLEALIACGEEAFGPAMDDPDVRQFWWPRFKRAAQWLAGKENEWNADRAASTFEKKHAHHYADVDFTLTGTPDRIDRRKSGGLRVIDYKTGSAPSPKQVKAFMAPQLPLLAALARAGAFGPEFEAQPAELLYAVVSGGKVAGKQTALEDPIGLTDALEQKLKDRVRKFDRPDMPYASRVAPEKVAWVGDYDHLARLDEWGDIGEDELP